MTFRKDISSLRALAVIFVVLYHFKLPFFNAGFIGVDIFFVISGFLMTKIIYGKIIDNNFSLINFYIDRSFRIIPALFFLIVIFMLVGWFYLFPLEYKQLAKESISSIFFLSNVLYWKQSGYFDLGAEELYLLHTWSLAVEWQFYLVYPILLMILFKILNAKYIKMLIIIIFFLSLFLSIFFSMSNPIGSFYLLPTRAWEMLLGGIIYLFPISLSKNKTSFLQFTALIIMILSLIFLNKQMPWPSFWALIPVMGAALFILVNNQNSLFSNNKVLQVLGVSSYSIYLWHWPIFIMLNMNGYLDNQFFKIGGIIFSVLMGYLSYKLIETYFLNIKKSGLSRAKLIIIICSLFIIVLPIYLVYSSNGVDTQVRSINHNEKSVFLQKYKDLHEKGLAEAYKLECDFYDNDKKIARDFIPKECTEKLFSDDTTQRDSIFLWGDSHVQALSLGIREQIKLLPKPMEFYQVATSGCPPSLTKNPRSGKIDNNCPLSNEFALKEIERLKPTIVILAQSSHHEEVDWENIAKVLQDKGVKNVIIIGPVPQYKPSLPAIYVRKGWDSNDNRIKSGLDNSIINTNNEMLNKYNKSKVLHYISPINYLCNDIGCKVILNMKERELMLVDYGHLSPNGSLYLGNYIFNQLKLRDILK